jgi:hypothetical protein
MIVALLLAVQAVSAQELKSPPADKSLVYFVRASGTGALINFKYFDGEDYLGKFSGVNYFLHECEPGKHTFWVTAENRDFVEADLLPGKTYVIEVRPTMGMMKAAVKLIPFDKNDEKSLKKLTKILEKHEPLTLDNQSFDDEEEKLEFFIANGLKKYEEEKAKGKVALLAAEDYYQ